MRTYLCAALALLSGAVWAGDPAPRDPNADGIFDAADVARITGSIGAWNPQQQPNLDADQNGVLDGRDTNLVSSIILTGARLPPVLGVSEEVANGVHVTNAAAFAVEISVRDASGAFTVSDGTDVLFSGTTSGTGTAMLMLEPGRNLFKLVLEDSAGRTVLREIEILRDINPPQVVIDTPLAAQLVTALNVPVAGQALDGETPVSVTVNGTAMTIFGDGTWSGAVPFPIDQGGLRTLTAVARDAAGNTAHATRDFELFVSPPQTLSQGAARLDLEAGALCQRGEVASVGELTNANVRSMLGPGSEMIVTSASGGLTDGVIVLPSAMMVAVEGQSNEGQDVVGAERQPLFGAPAEISLENESGATNAMPLWIFQVIPDADGDGNAELSLVSRAKVAEDGPLQGRIVPVLDESLPFPNPFNPDVPVFGEEALARHADVPAVRELLDRLAATRARGGNPQARVTFYCCAASAVVPVTGRIRCGTLSAVEIIDRLSVAEANLRQTAMEMQGSANKVVEAEDTRINAVTEIAGLTDVSLPGGGTVAVPTLLNGRAFGCLKNFVPASAALTRLEAIEGTLGDIGLIQIAVGAGEAPLLETAAALTDKALDHAAERLRARAETVALEEFQGVVDKAERLERYKEKLGVLNNVYNCAALGLRINEIITSVTTIFTEPDVADALQAAYDNQLKVYKRFADCYRQNIAVTEGARDDESVFRGYMPFDRGLSTIAPRLQMLQSFSIQATANEDGFADLLEEMAVLEQPGHQHSVAELEGFIDRIIDFLEEEQDLIMRQDEVFSGFDAMAEAAMMTPVLVQRITNANATMGATNATSFAGAGGYPGAYVSLQGANSPLATVTGSGGDFLHFVNSALTIDNGPPRVAILGGRTYVLDADAENGLLSGTGSGSVTEHVFPFTPLSTVDFDVVVEIPDVSVNPSVSDTNGIAPTIDIVTPTADQIGFAGRPMLIETMSSDDVAVMGVEVTVNGVSETGLPGGLARGVLMMPSDPGSVVINAIAADAGGNLGMDTVTVSIVDAEGAFLVSPNDVTVGLGETVQFTAMLLKQDVTTQVRWLVNGIEGGNPDVTGSIDATGLFDTGPLDVGAPAVYRVRVQAELPLYPGFRPESRVTVLDSRNVVARAVAFSFPAPSAPGGLLISSPVGFSFPSPGAPGGLLTSNPVSFSFPSPSAPGGLVVSKPISIERQ